MSLWSSLKNVGTTIVKGVAGYFTGGVGGAVSGVVGSVAEQRQARNEAAAGQPPVTTAGGAAGGVVQTLPTLRQGAPVTGTGVPTPGGLMSRIGQGLGQFGTGLLQGGLQQVVAGGAGGGAIATKRGRITGNFIPRGYVEKMSPSGVIYLAKQRRRRGISSRDISAFYRVNRLVSKIHGRAHTRTRKGR